ncbi:MAG: hypothetical protein K2W78_14625 [Xanthobacteraceae bacterium]|nr:hypothetical protein [Xanthobacteraceae bacterium]
MGIILQFPADAAARRADAETESGRTRGMATVVILPAIRIERHAEETAGDHGPKEGTAPGRRRRRRARS